MSEPAGSGLSSHLLLHDESVAAHWQAIAARFTADNERLEHVTPAVRNLNAFIEAWDAQTDYAFDRAGIYLIACLIVDHAQYLEFKKLCAEAGLFI